MKTTGNKPRFLSGGKEKIEKFSQNTKSMYISLIGLFAAMSVLCAVCLLLSTKEIDVSELEWDFEISDSGNYVITGQSKEIAINVVRGNPTITFKDLSIDVSAKDNMAAFRLGNSTSATITLEGENVLKSGEYCAGLQTQETSFLEITEESEGALVVKGGKYGAGIGSGASTESLYTYAPGIGTGQYFGSICLLGGEIRAEGGQGNYDIGGEPSENDKIIIDGAKVQADEISSVSNNSQSKK